MLPANIPSYHAIACGREPQGSYHRCASLGPQIWPAAPADPAHAWHLWQSVASASWTTSNISKDGTYNLWLALTTSAWVLSCTNDHFSTLNCIRLDLATQARLMSHKKRPYYNFAVYTPELLQLTRGSCGAQTFLRRGTAEWLTAPKKTRWSGWPRWPLHKIAKWNAKLIELQSVQARLRDVDFRLDKSDWPPGHRGFTEGGFLRCRFSD